VLAVDVGESTKKARIDPDSTPRSFRIVLSEETNSAARVWSPSSSHLKYRSLTVAARLDPRHRTSAERERAVTVWDNLYVMDGSSRLYALLGISLLLVAPACGKRSRTPPTQPPPNYLELGETYFDTGDYPSAIKSFNTYLKDRAGAPDADRALFRLAMAYGVAEAPAQDLPKGMQLLQQLVKQYPSSPFKPPAMLLIRLQDEVTKLKDDVTKLRADATKRDEKVKELTTELEKLKKIDMERRPTRVPR